jgi:hypothetical protein
MSKNHENTFVLALLLFFTTIIIGITKSEVNTHLKPGEIITVLPSRKNPLDISIKAIETNNIFDNSGPICILDSETMEHDGGKLVILGFENTTNQYFVGWSGKPTSHWANACTALSNFKITENELTNLQNAFHYNIMVPPLGL